MDMRSTLKEPHCAQVLNSKPEVKRNTLKQSRRFSGGISVDTRSQTLHWKVTT